MLIGQPELLPLTECTAREPVTFREPKIVLASNGRFRSGLTKPQFVQRGSRKQSGQETQQSLTRICSFVNQVHGLF